MELTINIPGGIVMNQTREAISQRQKVLLDYLKEHNTARVSDLCRHLDVSEITVRRDLNELENQKLLERFHGGARIKKVKPENDVAFEEKGVRHEAQKNAIGREAAHLVENGSTVFLNSGSTTLAALKYLNEKNVRIITNNALAQPLCNPAPRPFSRPGNLWKHPDILGAPFQPCQACAGQLQDFIIFQQVN